MRTPRLVNIIIFSLLCSTAVTAAPLKSETSHGDLLLKPVTVEEVEQLRKESSTDSSLNESQLQQVKSHLDQALNWMSQSDTARESLIRLQKRIDDAPNLMDKLRIQHTKLLQPAEKRKTTSKPSTTDITELELKLSNNEIELSQIKTDFKAAQEHLNKLLLGSNKLNQEISVRNSRISQISSDMALHEKGEISSINRSQALAIKARLYLRTTENQHAKLKLANLNLLTALAQAERDLLEGKSSNLQGAVDELKPLIQQLREEIARNARLEAEAEEARSLQLPDIIKNIAEQTALYHQELEQLVQE